MRDWVRDVTGSGNSMNSVLKDGKLLVVLRNKTIGVRT